MPNVQQPEMRRSEQTRLVQDSDGPQAKGRGRSHKETHKVPTEQFSEYGPAGGRKTSKRDEPAGRDAEGD